MDEDLVLPVGRKRSSLSGLCCLTTALIVFTCSLIYASIYIYRYYIIPQVAHNYMSGIKPETHCTIFGCPRWKISIVKQPWRFLWSWLLNGGPVSYADKGSKMAVITVLRPKIAYDHFLQFSEIQHDHRTECLQLRPTFTDRPKKKLTWNQRDMALKHKTAVLKLLSLLFHRFHFFKHP